MIYLLTNSAPTLFDRLQCSAHCLNILLQPKKATDYELRNMNRLVYFRSVREFQVYICRLVSL